MPDLRFQTLEFRIEREMIDVTSMNRVDTNWFYTDPAGHLHQWWDVKPYRPATKYSPQKSYHLPSLCYVEDAPSTEDAPGYGHLECRWCKAHVIAGYTGDDIVQMIPGLAWCYINDQPVTKAVFDEELAKTRK